jgi:membrane protein YqaA with SNARE-associated domain
LKGRFNRPFFVMWEFEAGYIGLFLSAFFAATIVPVASEAVLLGMLAYHYEPLACLLVASSGNTLGAILNYYIGYLAKPIWLKKIHVSITQIEQWKNRVHQYGVWLALFSWLPLIGDLIGVALGFFRTPKFLTFVFFAIGKLLRYGIVILLYFLF